MLGHAPFQPAPPPAQPSQPQSQPSSSPTTINPSDPNGIHHNPTGPAQQQPPGTFQTLRLRDDPPAVTPPTTRASRKRKSPSSNTDQPQQPQHQPQHIPQPPQHMPPPGMQLPPPHSLMHAPPPHMGGPPMPHAYQYAPTDYTPGGIPPPHPGAPPPPGHGAPPPQDQSPGASRTLSQSKRAEQNRKAQRAFRERRDQHVKALESRSQLLDAALASADEANRRWEECRALVDQLRIENAALRAALTQAQIMGAPNGQGNSNGANSPGQEESRKEGEGGEGENRPE